MANRAIREEKNQNKLIPMKNRNYLLELIRKMEKNLDDILTYQEKEYEYVAKLLERYRFLKKEISARFQTYSRPKLENMTMGQVIINKSIGREERSRIYQEECEMSPDNYILSGKYWLKILRFLGLYYPGILRNIPNAFDLKELLDSLNIEFNIFKDDTIFYIKIHAEESIQFKDGVTDIFSELKKIQDESEDDVFFEPEENEDKEVSSGKAQRVIREAKENVPKKKHDKENEIINKILQEYEKNVSQLDIEIAKRDNKIGLDIESLYEEGSYIKEVAYVDSEGEINGEVIFNGFCFTDIPFRSVAFSNGTKLEKKYALNVNRFKEIARVMGDKRVLLLESDRIPPHRRHDDYVVFEEYLDFIGATYHIKKKKKKINSLFIYSGCGTIEEISFDIIIDKKRLEKEEFEYTDILFQDDIIPNFLEKLTKSKMLSDTIHANLQICEDEELRVRIENFDGSSPKLVSSKMTNVIQEKEKIINKITSKTLKMMQELLWSQFQYFIEWRDVLDGKRKIEIRKQNGEILTIMLYEKVCDPNGLDMYTTLKELIKILGKSYETMVNNAVAVVGRDVFVNLSIFFNETGIGRKILKTITDVQFV